MANLLTRKVMENMSKQYRKNNEISSSISNEEEKRRNIKPEEEELLLGLIKNNLINTKEINKNNIKKQISKEVKKLKLEDLIGCSKKSAEKATKTSYAITLDELAQKRK